LPEFIPDQAKISFITLASVFQAADKYDSQAVKGHCLKLLREKFERWSAEDIGKGSPGLLKIDLASSLQGSLITHLALLWMREIFIARISHNIRVITTDDEAPFRKILKEYPDFAVDLMKSVGRIYPR
jgi:hypothetical protein